MVCNNFITKITINNINESLVACLLSISKVTIAPLIFPIRKVKGAIDDTKYFVHARMLQLDPLIDAKSREVVSCYPTLLLQVSSQGGNH